MRRSRKLAFAAVTTGALLLLGECGARVVGAPDCGPITPRATGWHTMTGDPRLLWKLEPGRFDTPAGATENNALGLRSPHMPSDKGPDERRVLVTGDSSVYGWGQPDGLTYAEQLERALNLNTQGVTVEVINLGVPGYSTEQTLRLLEDVGWSYEPDLVVVHNIFSDCNIDAFQDRTALALADPDPGPAESALHASRLYCGLYMGWAETLAGLGQQPNRVLMPGIPTGPNSAARLEKIDQLIDLSRVPLEDYLDNLETIRAEAEARGAAMMVAPLAQEWDVGLWRVDMPEPGPDQVFPWTPYRQAQSEWAAERGVPQVYLPEVFAEAAGDQPERLFIDNMHPSVVGAVVMAEAITGQIRQRPELLDLSADQLTPERRGLPMPEFRMPEQGGPGGPPGQGGPPQHGEGASPPGQGGPPQGPPGPSGQGGPPPGQGGAPPAEAP